MCLLEMKALLLYLSVLLSSHKCGAIINRSSQLQHNNNRYNNNAAATKGGSMYLNSQRPLWILEDQVKQRGEYAEAGHIYTTRKPYYYSHYYRNKPHQPQPKLVSRPQQQQQQLRLPKRYSFKEKPAQQQRQRQRQQRFYNSSRHYIPIRRENTYANAEKSTMPIFDSEPGDELMAGGAVPIFVYNGPKGELIVNTMLSTHKYPMQEPVPGQILYPPTSPIFRPRPIVERVRIPGRADPVNLTLIPFYAHEAIMNPRSYDATPAASAATTAISITTPAPPPTVLYAAPAATAAGATATAAEENTAPTKKRRSKQAKKYAVFHSPQEVFWQPTAQHLAALQLANPSTTPFPLTLASPLQNHRYIDINEGGNLYTTPTTPSAMRPHNFKLTYRDDEDEFHIVYVDESLEKPSTTNTLSTPAPTPKPLLSSRYTIAKEYYAFPVFTLGKLLQPENEKHMRSLTNGADPPAQKEKQQNVEVQNEAKEETANENTDTWFILNSRYKGQHKHNEAYRLSSKYVQQQQQQNTAAAAASADIATATMNAENPDDLYENNELVS